MDPTRFIRLLVGGVTTRIATLRGVIFVGAVVCVGIGILPIVGEAILGQHPAASESAAGAAGNVDAPGLDGLGDEASLMDVRTSEDLSASAELLRASSEIPESEPNFQTAPSQAAALQAAALIGPPPPPLAFGPPPPPAKPLVVSGIIEPGSALGGALAKQGVSSQNIHHIDRGMRPVFDFRQAHPGDRYRLILHADGSIIDFRYSPSPLLSYHYFREGDRFVAEREEAELTRRQEVLAGTVTSTFYKAIQDMGEQGTLANAFTDLFAWDIDFSRDVRPGDQFKILYERFYRTDDTGQEVYVRPGRVLAGRYQGSVKGSVGTHTAVYYSGESGKGGFYRKDGSSIERQFLMSPLQFGRITSSYTMARKHPILKITRPHQGIDYAAPEGTPIWAVADGKVIFKAQTKGFGRTVKIRHNNGYISYYTHMSRYLEGLYVGQRVNQKEVVGYVGHSGLATGPHVCFRIAKDGRYINPKTLRSPAGAPIPPDEFTSFSTARDVLLEALGGESEEGSSAVAMLGEDSASL